MSPSPSCPPPPLSPDDDALEAPEAPAACETCAELERRRAATGHAYICTDCGTVHADDDFTLPANDDVIVDRYRDARTALPSVLAALERARRGRALVRAQVGAGPGFASSPLSRWQGRVVTDAAVDDASDVQVQALWRLVTTGESKHARSARGDFVDALVKYCAATGGSPSVVGVEELDEAEERAAISAASHLAVIDLADPAAGEVLHTLTHRPTRDVSWEEAAEYIAERCAPRALLAAWSLPQVDAAPRRGRPRRDVTRPSPALERRTWGEAALARAIAVWNGPL